MFTNHLRRRCCGCAFLLLLLVLLTALVLGFGVAWGVRSANAAPATDTMDAVLLSPQINPAPRAGQRRGVFYRAQLAVDVWAERVWLAASPDGRADLCVDDQATVTFRQADRPPLRWLHRFSSSDRRAITCLPAHDLSGWLRPGQYQVEVVLEDLLPPTYRAQPLFLVFEEVTSAAPTRAIAAPPTQMQRATASPTAVTLTAASALQVPSVVSISTAVTPVNTPIALFNNGTSATMVSWWRVSLAALALLGLATCTVLARRWFRGRSPPAMSGILDLADAETGAVRTTLLHVYPHGAAVTRSPLDVVAWSPRDSPAPGNPPIVYILPMAGGLVLREVGAGATDRAVERDAIYTVAQNAVTLRFRQ